MGGNLLMSVLPNNFGCPPILTTYEGQVGLRANKGLNWSNHFIYYSAPGSRSQQSPVPFSGTFTFQYTKL